MNVLKNYKELNDNYKEILEKSISYFGDLVNFFYKGNLIFEMKNILEMNLNVQFITTKWFLQDRSRKISEKYE